MRSDRLLSILLLLQTRGQLPAAELAERLEVSVRTIMRDVEALSSAGVPVYTVRGPQGGIALLPGYRTDVTGLTADESRALFVLMSGSAHADLGLGPALGSALRKVMAALPAPHRPDADLTSRRILIDPVRWRGIPGPSQPGPDFAAFQQAVFADRRLRLRYRRGRDNSVRTYTLDPYGLVNKAGVWYLVADHRGEPRLFRTDRAQSATALAEPVQRRPGQELADVWEILRRRIDDIPAPLAVTVRVRDETLPLFLRFHAADLAPGDPSPEESGWTRLELRFRSLYAAQPLLSFGPDVEVLAPDNLRRLLADTAAAITALYA
ncbi:helix-turn-helix transcriptional regulator [Kutzneria sp. NPDC052558]|uniref:helix-turn-helix transcriptional regulator n=1 Tax=Kutzneria sp. NPDC052558 TaxID=3364121 RepID=UPI0037CB0306